MRLHINGEVSTALRKSGLDYQVIFGLDANSIQEVSSKFQPDLTLTDQSFDRVSFDLLSH
ncbi:MAG TPA: hypothetical protein VFP20_05015 [Bacteroidales bacterium]|nr:hypothetical protein [Bacteroidales bacterium]